MNDKNERQDDPVNHPSHYTDGKIEVIDFIEDKNLNFHRGNAVKYIARAGKKSKDTEIQDLEKAAWYIDREIKRLEAKKMSNQFKSVYTNDPANMVAEAFAELHPDVKYEAALSPELYDDKGTPICSCITFPNEGDDADAVPIIVVNSQLGVEVAAAELAMQLIHAALGFESLQGGEEYDAALNALKTKYNEIGNERFPESAAAEPVGGGGNE